ncbi:MAG: nucleotidyl transferase AbiEii/AbiGii toxin family protein [Brumimicrobium sp.]|nr:nucleotidyl transferase AbiEii/AbiGii toxin family protein [Brumimicrobium sp.]
MKVTFFHYPYPIEHPLKFDKIITTPNLMTLSAMKAFALGRRAKWKDYVDLYFLFKNHISLTETIAKAKEIFKDEFSEKLFKQQLVYFNDIDYQEDVVYLPNFAVNEEEVKTFLIEVATREF